MTGIVADGLGKRFGETLAVDDVSFEVREGSVVALLGPNGAGKTTVVRILTTLLRPDEGRASVAGYDVIDEPAAVRASIALTGQYAAIDENLTGRENLVMVGELSQLSRRDARRRADDLLERFDLTDAADRVAKGYSGGMGRRLDLAMSLIAQPRVLFLDEPTTGLDPRSRRGMWQIIRELVGAGTTLLLTTQYLEEADALADRIVLIDRGAIIAEGTAHELKDEVGGDVLEVAVDGDATGAAQTVSDVAVGEVEVRDDRLFVPVGQDSGRIAEALKRLTDAGYALRDVRVQEPTLDDVFFALTGDHAEREEAA